MEQLMNLDTSVVVEDLESRRLMTTGGLVETPAEVPAAGGGELEVVLSYDGLDPIIASMISAPETIEPAEWRVLEKRFVVPTSARGAIPVAAPNRPNQALPADQFRVMANGNHGYFAKNYGHLDVVEPHIFGVGHAQTPAEIDYDILRNEMQRAVNRGAGAIMDIEHLPVDITRFGEAAVLESMAVYQAVIDVARSEFPDLEIGFYGTFPIRDLYTPLQYREALHEVQNNGDPWWVGSFPKFRDRYLEWQRANDFLAPIASQVDVIYPSLYTFSADPQDWVYYAEENIKQAARYGKPVRAFLWNRYHNGYLPRSRELIEPEYWRLQLDTVRRLTSGVVVFDDVMDPAHINAGQHPDYGTQHGWYNQTVDFFQDIFDDAQVDLL